jgi:hypothetical protein
VANDTQQLFRDAYAVVWFLDGEGKVVDVVQGQLGVQDVDLRAKVLRPGQPANFKLESTNDGRVPEVAHIKSVKVLAFAREVPLP